LSDKRIDGILGEDIEEIEETWINSIPTTRWIMEQ